MVYMCMCVYVDVYVGVYMCVYMGVCVYPCVQVHVCVCVRMLYIYIYIQVASISTDAYVRMKVTCVQEKNIGHHEKGLIDVAFITS